MKPIEPYELSAYIDGELSDTRVREIEVLLEHDAVLRAELEQMKAMDAAWTSAARTAVSRPRIQLSQAARSSGVVARTACIVAALLAVRLLPKVADLVMWGVALHAIVLAMTVVWLTRSEE